MSHDRYANWRTDVNPQTEKSAAKARRVQPRSQPPVRYLYAAGRRYRVTDANAVVDGLGEQGRPGHLG
jgi:hypothetical protein